MSKDPLTLPALDPTRMTPRVATTYPDPFKAEVEKRAKRALGDTLGLTQFGVNLVRLEPGAWSAQRHWHSKEDEFVFILEGELTLVTDDGEQVLGPGKAAGFPAGRADGHHLVNRSAAPATYLEVGSRIKADEVHYPDIDLFLKSDGEKRWYTRKDGKPY